MARSSFRLERVLRIRTIQEEVARAEWLAAARIAVEAENATEACLATRDEATRDLGESQAGLDVPGILWRQQAIDNLSQVAGRLRERALTLRFQADLARTPFQERRQQVRGLERLKKRAITAQRDEEQAVDAALMDEFAIVRASRLSRSHPGKE